MLRRRDARIAVGMIARDNAVSIRRIARSGVCPIRTSIAGAERILGRNGMGIPKGREGVVDGNRAPESIMKVNVDLQARCRGGGGRRSRCGSGGVKHGADKSI